MKNYLKSDFMFAFSLVLEFGFYILNINNGPIKYLKRVKSFVLFSGLVNSC